MSNRFEDYHLRLPLDADGVPWHVGDEIDFLNDNRAEVVAISPNQLYYYDDGSETVEWTQASTRRHWRPTVEWLLRDMIESLDLDPSSAVDTNEVIAEYAPMLRLADG